jgi:hypothetical protein
VIPLSNLTISVVVTVFEIILTHWKVAFAYALASAAITILMPSCAPRHGGVNPLKLKLFNLYELSDALKSGVIDTSNPGAVEVSLKF